MVREVAHHLLREGETVGMLMLEESTKRTAKGLMGIELSEPIHLDMTPWADLTAEQQAARRQAYEATVGSGRLFLYDHFGSTISPSWSPALRTGTSARPSTSS